MLAKRIIPTILCRGRTLVKGSSYDAWRAVGVAAQAARIHSMRGVDELVLLDIAATPENRGPDANLIKELSAWCFTPLAVGGGITRMEHVQMLLEAGARIEDFAGGTRLGESLASLHRQHARRLVGRRTLVLIVSDGLDTGEPELLARELAWLKRHTRRILWLNPLLRFDGYQPLARGAAVLHKACDGTLAVHNVTKLNELANAIAALMKQ